MILIRMDVDTGSVSIRRTVIHYNRRFDKICVFKIKKKDGFTQISVDVDNLETIHRRGLIDSSISRKINVVDLSLTLPQKILFTAVFTIYWFIFYGIVYYALSWWDPALLDPPEHLSQIHVLTAVSIFTGLVVLAYIGSGFVVLGHIPGWPARRESRRNYDPDQPAPGERLRKSRRFFGNSGKSKSTPAVPAPKRGQGPARKKKSRPQGDSPRSGAAR